MSELQNLARRISSHSQDTSIALTAVNGLGVSTMTFEIYEAPLIRLEDVLWVLLVFCGYMNYLGNDSLELYEWEM
jgi:hypothetical protein